ncbi:MAG: ribose 5-phosphate isomerase B [Bacteroidetes bacterium]|nr:ribose 5-phosphate isomerase B [Bacteroidota bacterium]
MKLSIGSDHAGFTLKEVIKTKLSKENFVINDCGTYSLDSVDYPDFAHKVATSVVNKEVELGILVCGTGNGVAIAANKHKGIRAALCWNKEIAALAKQHNNANIISLPARFITDNEAIEIINTFLNATFEGNRHQKRIEKIDL